MSILGWEESTYGLTERISEMSRPAQTPLLAPYLSMLESGRARIPGALKLGFHISLLAGVLGRQEQEALSEEKA